MNLESMTDEDIIESARNGLDRNVALTEIYKRHKGHISAISWRYLKNGELVKENLGKVSLKLVTNLLKYKNYKDGAKFSTWLYGVTKNTAIDIIRERKRNKVDSVNLKNENKYETSAEEYLDILQNKYSESKDPESIIVENEISSRLENEMSRLKKKDFDLIYKYYFEGIQLKEFSKEANLNNSTARGNHKRILEKLRKRINGNKGFFYSL